MANSMLNIHAYILLKVKDKIFQVRQIVKHCLQDIKNIYHMYVETILRGDND